MDQRSRKSSDAGISSTWFRVFWEVGRELSEVSTILVRGWVKEIIRDSRGVWLITVAYATGTGFNTEMPEAQLHDNSRACAMANFIRA